MPRPDKVQAVAEIKERIERARAVFLAEYAGLSVKDQQNLRRSLREGGAEFKVVKMTLARRAADELDLQGLDELLLGPTGLTFADGDPVTAAKALKDFAKDHEVFAIKGGLLGADLLTPERVSELAEIEPREVLLAKIAGAAKAPMANLAGLLAAMPRNLASMMLQLVEKKDSGEVPAPADADASGADDEKPAGDTAPEAEDTADAAAEVDEETDEAPEAAATDDVAADESADADDEATDADADASEEPEAAAEAESATAADVDADAETAADSGDDEDDEPTDAPDADASEDEEE